MFLYILPKILKAGNFLWPYNKNKKLCYQVTLVTMATVTFIYLVSWTITMISYVAVSDQEMNYESFLVLIEFVNKK